MVSMFSKQLVFGLLAAVLAYVHANEPEQRCFNRFEYEYNVLQKLVDLQRDNDNLTLTVERLQAVVTTLTHGLEEMRHTINRGTTDGSVYTRWGRSSCPNNTKTEFIYDGYAASGYYGSSGGGSTYICLPRTPTSSPVFTGDTRTGVHGVEYEIPNSVIQGLQDHDVPCAVCRTPGSSVLMVPGRNTCYPDWQIEYNGYLVTQYYSHAGNKDHVCMDSSPQTLNTGSENNNGAMFYLTVAKCSTLPCPPYVDSQILTCAVCSYSPTDK